MDQTMQQETARFAKLGSMSHSYKLMAILLSLYMPIHAAMEFDGIDDCVDMGDVLNLSTNITISVWLKTSNSTPVDTHASFVGKYNANGYILWAHTSGDSLRWGDSDSGKVTWNGGKILLEDNQWHHVVGWREGTEGKLYFDGVEVASNTGFVDSTSSQSIEIGSYNVLGVTCNFGHYGGLIDDVRIYNSALTQVEIESLYKSRGRLAFTDGLAAWYPLDEGVDGATALGATALDRSGNGLTGTPSNGPIWRASTFVNYP